LSGGETFRKAAAEFIGTFAFVLVGAGSAVAGAAAASPPLLTAAFANGLGLAAMVSATMAVSGGSLNPAVTLALLAARKLSLGEAASYVVAELAGAALAGGVMVVSLPAALGASVRWGAPSLGASVSPLQGTLLELVMTVALVTAVFGTAVDQRGPKVGGLAIGLTVMADVLLGGPFTGAAMNPARAIGPMLAGGLVPDYWWIYWLGPIAGALLASYVYRYLFLKGR